MSETMFFIVLVVILCAFVIIESEYEDEMGITRYTRDVIANKVKSIFSK